MRIRKIESVTATNGTIVDSLDGNSKTDAPSINAVNNKFKEISTYSTEEKVIGTWIDGKLLYRKVYVFNVAAHNSSYLTAIDNNPNIETLINFYGNFTATNGSGQRVLGSSTTPSAAENTRLYIDQNGNLVFQASAYDVDIIVKAVVEYTKTTDSATNTVNIINDEPILEEPTI